MTPSTPDEALREQIAKESARLAPNINYVQIHATVLNGTFTGKEAKILSISETIGDQHISGQVLKGPDSEYLEIEK